MYLECIWNSRCASERGDLFFICYQVIIYALIHVTSRKVADKCGVSRQAVEKWEKGINFIILSLDRLF